MYHPSEFKCIATQKKEKLRLLFGKFGFKGELPTDHFELFREMVRQFGLHCTVDLLIHQGRDSQTKEVSLLSFMGNVLKVPPARLLEWIGRVKSVFEYLDSEDESVILELIAKAKQRLQPPEETLKQLLIIKSLDNPRKNHQQLFEELHERVWTLGEKAQNRLAMAFDKVEQNLSLREGFNVST